MSARRLSRKGLAEQLGVDPSQITRWMSGSMPPPDEQERIVRAMGGDLSRVLPGYDPVKDAFEALAGEAQDFPVGNGNGGKTAPATPQPDRKTALRDLKAALDVRNRTVGAVGKPARTVPLLGHVNAGAASVCFEAVLARDSGSADVPAWASIYDAFLERCRHPACSDDLFALEVRGSSMQPAYPDGAVLVCAPVLDHGSVPSGTDVVLEEVTIPRRGEAEERTGTYTFKRLKYVFGPDGRLLLVQGIPLNPIEHEIVDYPPGTVRVHALVYGCIAFMHRKPPKPHRGRGNVVPVEPGK